MVPKYLVKLINESKTYLDKGLKKGMEGRTITCDNNHQWTVWFFDFKNFNLNKNKKDIDPYNFIIKAQVYENDLEMKLNPDYLKALSYDGEEISEYDLVEVVNENDDCKKYGITTGMTGVILESSCHKGKWSVTFTDKSTLQDIAIIHILGNDLKIIKN